MANTKNYTFFTDEVGYEETETKGGKDYFVTGYISTKDRDLVNDVVSENALSEMLNQINHKNIKLDVEHEAWREENPSIVPVGKIIEAKRDEKGIFVKAILNRAHGRFKEVWDSVKSGFLDAFSIAFKTTSYVHKVVDGVKTRILNGVELLNVALTGNPVNPECKMTEVFTKSLKDMEEIKMAEEVVEKKDEEVQAPAEEAAPVAEEPAVEPVAEVEAEVEEPTEETSEVEQKALDRITKLEDDLADAKTEIKSLTKKLNEPILKDNVETLDKEQIVAKGTYNPLDAV
jgi:HK97 family phage prohead protease|tara:strand:+ start:53 stop:916 length:864 start_codon:yes stop_codon:yes gene_type:complete